MFVSQKYSVQTNVERAANVKTLNVNKNTFYAHKDCNNVLDVVPKDKMASISLTVG